MAALPDIRSDESALTELLRSGLLYVAVRALGDVDEAHDALQEAVTRTIAAVRNGSVPPTVRLAAFAYGVMRHVIVDTLHARRREVSISPRAELAPDPQPSPLELLVTAEDEARIRTALTQLRPDERELLERCFLRGERVSTIGRVLGIPAARIRKRKSRALKRLRELLADPKAGHVRSPPATYFI